jgi:hypothetical protein
MVFSTILHAPSQPQDVAVGVFVLTYHQIVCRLDSLDLGLDFHTSFLGKQHSLQRIPVIGPVLEEPVH